MCNQGELLVFIFKFTRRWGYINNQGVTQSYLCVLTEQPQFRGCWGHALEEEEEEAAEGEEESQAC